MNVLIVDDEPIARDILKNYCSFFPEIKIVGSSSNSLEAKNVLNAQEVDLMFLDINMPVIDGVSFLKHSKLNPRLYLPPLIKSMRRRLLA